MESQRVRHDLGTKQQQKQLILLKIDVNGNSRVPQDFGLNNRKDELTSAKVTKAVGRMWKVDRH